MITPWSPDTDMAITCRSLRKAYRTKMALDQLSLEIPESAFCILVGPNGSGKTTTMRILLDLVRPDSGKLTVLGLNPIKEGPRIRSSAGYVPEQQGIGYPWMRVGCLLQYHAAHYPTWDHAYARRLIHSLRIDPKPKLRSLSKGERRRVDLVTALAHRPPLLLLDEPLEGLDPLIRETVVQVVADHLSRFRTTVLASTHHVEDLNTLCSHLAAIREGRLVGYGSREDLHEHLLSYRLKIPDGWTGKVELGASVLKRIGVKGEVIWTIWGDENLVSENLVHHGITIQEIQRHTIEEAAVFMLGIEADIQ